MSLVQLCCSSHCLKNVRFSTAGTVKVSSSSCLSGLDERGWAVRHVCPQNCPQLVKRKPPLTLCSMLQFQSSWHLGVNVYWTWRRSSKRLRTQKDSAGVTFVMFAWFSSCGSIKCQSHAAVIESRRQKKDSHRVDNRSKDMIGFCKSLKLNLKSAATAKNAQVSDDHKQPGESSINPIILGRSLPVKVADPAHHLLWAITD